MRCWFKTCALTVVHTNIAPQFAPFWCKNIFKSGDEAPPRLGFSKSSCKRYSLDILEGLATAILSSTSDLRLPQAATRSG